MARSTYFVQECPTCGRSLQVRVEYLGREVVCQHCRGRFKAYDLGTSAETSAKTPPSLLHRAEQLLESIGQHRHRPVA